jgi:4-nitrophenyl phosphatase
VEWNGLRGWAFDLDGVIWAGEEPMPGALELIAALREAGRQVVFLSNNSGWTAAGLAEKLTQMGIAATAENVVSPVGAAGDFLLQQYGRVRVLVSGLPALADSLQAVGHTPVSDPNLAEAVVMGRDFDFNYERLALVCRAVDRGIPFIALNKDVRLPIEGGGWAPGLGAMVAAVVAATGREPQLVGKPSPLLFEAAMARMGTRPSESVMVGDTPAADIAGGLRAGMWTVLVGNSQAEPAAHMRVADPADLLGRWRSEEKI